MSKKILFISHEATRTGAPFVLLHLLRWLKAHTDYSLEVVAGKSGDLQAEFEALAPTTILDKQKLNGVDLGSRIKRRLASRTGLADTPLGASPYDRQLKRLAERLAREGVDLIYCNTVANGKLLKALSVLHCPVICHVHEMEYAIRHIAGWESFQLTQAHTGHYLAASQAVKENLVRGHAIAPESVDVVPEFIPAGPPPLARDSEVCRVLREQLQIPAGAFIIGASGTIDWRKGPDLFVQLARLLHARRPELPVYFVWVGGESEGRRFDEIWHDVRHAGLEKYVRFAGAQSNILEYFALFDVFAMVSREDPFPVVNLEAAAAGTPILCFAGAGGTPELVEDDCGFVVPYLDVEAMTTKLEQLIESEPLRAEMSRRAAQKVRERYDVSVVAPCILEIMQRYLPEERSRPSL